MKGCKKILTGIIKNVIKQYHKYILNHLNLMNLKLKTRKKLKAFTNKAKTLELSQNKW